MSNYSCYMWSVSDWHADEMWVQLDNREKGIYRELIDLCWISGAISSDLEILARYVHEPIEYFVGVWAKLRPKFAAKKNGFVHPRLEQDRRRLKNVRKTFKIRAEKGGKAFADKMRAKKELEASSRLNEAQTQTQTQTQTHKEENKNTLSAGADCFCALWDRYPLKDGRKIAFRHFTATVKTEQDVIDIGHALDHYLEHLHAPINSWKRPKNGATWFNNWRDWINWHEPEAPQKENYYDQLERYQREQKELFHQREAERNSHHGRPRGSDNSH